MKTYDYIVIGGGSGGIGFFLIAGIVGGQGLLFLRAENRGSQRPFN